MTDRGPKKSGTKKVRRAKTAKTEGGSGSAKRKRSVARAGASGGPALRAGKAENRARSGARGEQHRLKREAILRIASRLINRKGYAGMSLADIADKLHIRDASLDYYFKSTEELVFASFERAHSLRARSLSGRSRSRVAQPRQRGRHECPALSGGLAI
ncbi:MAG TPA: TetR/AcrR family transcriptional regulator [Myxococcales bacterium]|nr:TetR/AcrR family transcriptional regulator [Myxococcales bacterium]HIL81496.1 TetR/AcrR family transcriptional regulator [Myxococcales bacterium]